VTTHLIDPEGHVRPYRTMELHYSAFTWPDTRRLFAKIFAVTALLISGAIISIVPSLSVSQRVLGALPFAFLIWGMFWFVLIMLPDREHARAAPHASRLSRTAEGRDLLDEGESLRARRERLRKDCGADSPLLRAQDVATVWQEQLRLERELRARQEARLRDLTVPVSDPAPLFG